MDAISLSMANLAVASPADLGSAARTILMAVLSNTLVKGGMPVFRGEPPYARGCCPSPWHF